MLEFYRTQGGRRFIDGTVPKLAEAIDRLAAALERANAVPLPQVAEDVIAGGALETWTCDHCGQVTDVLVNAVDRRYCPNCFRSREVR